MSSSTRIATWFGIPIKVHVTLWILLPLIALQISRRLGMGSLLWGLAAAAGLFASVALHELGHSLVAMAKGCRVREILLVPIGGMAQMERLPARPMDEVLVAIAGPAVSLLLAGATWYLALLTSGLGSVRLATVLAALAVTNLALALFNLLPSFPMDGGRVYRAWLTPRVGRLEATRRAAKTGRFMAIAFGLFGLFTWNLVLVGIAVFIYMAAGAEYRTVMIQEAYKQHRSGPWAPLGTQAFGEDDPEVTVSPPPYERGRASSLYARPVRMQHDLFDELFKDWN